MIKLSDKPLATSSASGDNIFINRNGAIMQVARNELFNNTLSAPPIVPDVSGNVIPLTDSSDRPLVDLTVFGNTTQNGTPTPEAPVDLESVENPVVTINGKNLLENKSTSLTTEGITFTVNDDKSVTVKGTPTSNPARYLNANLTLPIGNYVLSGGGTSASVKLIIRITKSGGGYTYVESSGKETLFSVTAENVDLPRIAYIYVSGNEAVDTIIYPMIRLASISDSTYEPYKSQTLEVPYTLNGVGDVRDYVDFEKGVKVRKTTFDNITNISYSYVVNWSASTDYVQLNYNVSGRKGGNVLCSHFTRNGNVTGANGVGVYFTGSVLIFGCKKSMLEECGAVSGDSASYRTAFISWWNAQTEAGNPVKVLLVLAEPIETPLPAEEIEAFKQLTSYYPVTTITNSEGAEMGVEYVADTKNYIDNKLASLVASATSDTTEV